MLQFLFQSIKILAKAVIHWKQTSNMNTIPLTWTRFLVLTRTLAAFKDDDDDDDGVVPATINQELNEKMHSLIINIKR
jgi:hypothetical protein